MMIAKPILKGGSVVALLLRFVYTGALCWNSVKADWLSREVSTSVTEKQRGDLQRQTGLVFPSASRFCLYRRVSGLQGGDTSLKLRLTSEELRSFTRQDGLVSEHVARRIGNNPMVDDPELSEWHPNSIRRPKQLESPGDGWKGSKVYVLAETAPGGHYDVYVHVSDPLE